VPATGSGGSSRSVHIPGSTPSSYPRCGKRGRGADLRRKRSVSASVTRMHHWLQLSTVTSDASTSCLGCRRREVHCCYVCLSLRISATIGTTMLLPTLRDAVSQGSLPRSDQHGTKDSELGRFLSLFRHLLLLLLLLVACSKDRAQGIGRRDPLLSRAHTVTFHTSSPSFPASYDTAG